MKVLSISKRKFKELERLKLQHNISHSEGDIYTLKDKKGYDKQIQAVKLFNQIEGDGFSNKLLTINTLIDQKDTIDIEEIVMPNRLVVTGSQVVGFTMDYIDSINLKTILYDKNTNYKLAIEYLKQVGEIIDRVHSLTKYGKVENFYLNDIHEANFIFNKKTNKINAVDIDSCRISNNKPFASLYLTPFSPVEQFPKKYKVTKSKNASGYIEPDYNSDLYCYAIMILNYLSQDKIIKLTMKEFIDYLNYLCSIGFPYELLDCFYRLYRKDKNINPKDLLDMIPSNIEDAHLSTYHYVKSIKCK